MDCVCSGSSVDGLRSYIDNEQHTKSTAKKNEEWKEDSFSLTRRCGFALARIEKAVLMLENRVGGQMDCDTKTRTMQEKIGGMIVRHFRSSIQSCEKEIGAIGIDLAAVRREMDAEREKEKREMEKREKEREMAARKAEEERQREFSRKMREMESEREKEKREMEEMKRMNEKWIEDGRRKEEESKREEERKRDAERKREEERKRKEEEERRRNVKKGAAAIEVFQQDRFTLAGNMFTKTGSGNFHLLSHSFGAVVVRITFIIRAIKSEFDFGVISTDLTEQAKTAQKWFMDMKGGAGWNFHSNYRYSRQNGSYSHKGSACKAGGVGQRVVMEADGRVGKRTLKLSQDGETQPVFFSNIPVPFRFVVLPWDEENSVEIVSTEVLREPSIVGGDRRNRPLTLITRTMILSHSLYRSFSGFVGLIECERSAGIAAVGDYQVRIFRL
ncbi:hypothetical protein BLNAU_20907 [Blattamonas nauphoetae]|uniref:Uncharacterized protein n=1 Tax=Blattamonas nauphoetae TaxID=2049346 RepID=A0ABQ9WXE7_9EUKA|nr:hypothetical protein BLNAU_20907 [Blattamonas nauphoetae]